MTGVSVTFDIYHPYTAGAATYTGVSGTLTPDLPCGRGSGLAGELAWSHYLDVASSVDILDAVTRSAGSNSVVYADGDKVVVTGGASGVRTSTYVVIFVDYDGSSGKRAYLLRDTW